MLTYYNFNIIICIEVDSQTKLVLKYQKNS